MIADKKSMLSMGAELSHAINRVRRAFGERSMRSHHRNPAVLLAEQKVELVAKSVLRGEGIYQDWSLALEEYEGCWMGVLNAIQEEDADGL